MSAFVRRQSLRFWPYLFITVLLVAVYFPTFSGEFILDDRPLIENNPDIKRIHPPISYLFQEDGITNSPVTSGHHTGYYRPLINISYSMDYLVWGLRAPGFRATNLLFHLLCCCLLYYFVTFLIKDRSAALWATLLFALHPVNTEAVSWIGSRDNILAGGFSILSLFLYIKDWERRGRLKRVGSVLMFALAILSKEMGLMILPLFFLYQRLLSPIKRNVRDELISYLPYILIAIAYFSLRKIVTSSFSSPIELVNLWKSIVFAPYLLLMNLRLILLPFGLHNFVVGYPDHYLSWQAVAGAFYIAILAIFMWTFRKNQIALFSIFSYHVLIFPALHIIPTSAVSLVSMRWIYFPMAFLTIMFGLFIKASLKNRAFVTTGVLCAILMYFGAYSHILNRTLWKSEREFFAQEVLHFDNYYYAGGLAENLFGDKKYQDADKYFQIAIEHFPLEAIHYLNYAALLIDTNRPQSALNCLEKAKGLPMTDKRRGQWFNNMGVVHYGMGDYEKAVTYFRQAVMLCPSQLDHRTNLGGAYAAVGDDQKARSVLEKALEIDPTWAPALKNLAMLLIEIGKHSEAIVMLEKIPQEDWKKHGIQEIFLKAHRGDHG